MSAEQEANDTTLQTSNAVPPPEESLTDVVDQWKRNAFRRALERRHAAASYRLVVESAHLVRTSPS
jgi:hypothetical protein